jgi:hypothetical protein
MLDGTGAAAGQVLPGTGFFQCHSMKTTCCHSSSDYPDVLMSTYNELFKQFSPRFALYSELKNTK